VERGDVLIRAVAVAASALALAGPAAASTITWRTASDGPSGGAPVTGPKGVVALDRASANAQLAGALTAASRAALAKVNFTRDALVTVFGEFGCMDSLIAVSSIVQQGTTLVVKLKQNRPPPGTAVCQALFRTYRFLVVPKSQLRQPLPTRATVTVAHA
jgi:hypothetical protein